MDAAFNYLNVSNNLQNRIPFKGFLPRVLYVCKHYNFIKQMIVAKYGLKKKLKNEKRDRLLSERRLKKEEHRIKVHAETY